jgi:3-oxoisoapionate decarboxylase
MWRRQFLTSSSAALASASVGLSTLEAQVPMPPNTRNLPIGIDLFSIRDSGYDALKYLDYCAKLGARMVHFSEIRFLGSLEPANLQRIRAAAVERNIQLEIGMRSVCPTSEAFDAAQGTAEQQIERMIAAARTLGSPIIRAFLGTWKDRTGPIDKHIDATVKVLRAMGSKIKDAGLRIAIENHAGDMQARELKRLVEESGSDFVGVCLDSGNPMWAIEDPHLTLETLHPYVLTSHIRDTAVWLTREGAEVQWTRMGEGNVRIGDYLNRYLELCPGKPISLEIIVTGARKFPYLDREFWAQYRNTPAWEFSRFLEHARNGSPRPQQPPVPKEAIPQRQREDLELSLRWTLEHLNKTA